VRPSSSRTPGASTVCPCSSSPRIGRTSTACVLAVIAILGAHGDAGAVDPLTRALVDDDSTVRIYAAANLDALAARGVPAAHAPLATYTGPRIPADRLPVP
jgi:HEAT repeat protein